MNKILVTGITGNVGKEVATILDKKGVSLVGGVRNPDKCKVKFNYTLVQLDFDDPATFDSALEGIDKIFLVRPPQIEDVENTIIPFLEKAKKNVKHITFLSLYGVEHKKQLPHYRIEQAIINLGFDHTFLRAGFFMQNFDTQYKQDIKENNEIFLPAGKGKTAFIDVRDIAEVGALSLCNPENHRNQAYPLTGAQSLNYFEVAEIFTEILGRKITYAKPSPREYKKVMLAKGVEPDFVEVMLGLYKVVRLGFAKKIDPTTAQVLGRPPINLRQYVEDYRENWN